MTKRFIVCIIFTLLCMTSPTSAQTLEFQKVFEQHGVVMLLIDPNTGAIVDANSAAAQFYGHERDELKTMTIQQINTLSAAQVAEERTLAQNEGRNYFIFRHRLADGEIRTVEVHSHPFTSDGRLLLLSLIHDITPGRNLEQGMWHYQQRLEELVEARTAEIKSKHFLITLILTGSLLIVSIIAIMLFRGRARRQLIELLLRQSEERYRLAQEATGVGIWDWDVVNDHLYWDDRMWAMISYPPDNRRVSYTDWRSLLHPEDLASADQEVQKQLHLGQGFVIEFRMRTRDGGWRWFQGRGKVVSRTDDGAPCRMMGTHTDIHERRQAEERLRESEENLRITLRSIGDAVISTNVGGRVVSMNPVAESLTGWSEKEAVGQPLDEVFRIINEQTRQTGESPVDNVLKTGQILGLVNHTLLIAKDGRETPIADSGAPIKNSDGETTGVVLVFRDQSEERTAQRALKASEEMMRNSQSVAHICSYSTNLNENEIEKSQWVCSPEFYKLFGIDETYPHTIAGWVGFIHTDFRDEVVAYHESVVNEKTLFNKEYKIIRINDGEERWVHGTGELEFDEKGIPVRMHGAIQDITERKQAEEEKEKLQTQLTQAQKMESVGQLAGGVAHDFNNMLGVILGYAQLAMRKVGPDAPLYANLDEIRKAAERSADLTRQLLAFARQQTVAPKILDLNETVNGMINMLRRLIGEDMDLAWRPGSNLSSVFIDPSQVDQILTNLCVNARDAIVDTGKITIETASVSFDDAYCADHAGFVPGEFVMLAVSDDGCGMDAETLSHIFEPFFSTKEMGKGTGLGLATVYGIAKQNNGFINVYSEPGHGTIFKIYLPQHAAKAAPWPEQEQAPMLTAGGKIILLVEDEPAILEVTSMMLDEMGYAVIAAGSPGEAIRLAREHHGRIDLLMTDVVMPEMNGRDLAGNLMSIYPDIRHLFMSGYTANVIAHHGVLDPGVHFLQKPFSIKDLATKIREALDHKEPNREND